MFLAEHSQAEFIESEIHDRRGVEREKLAYDETANDGDAERTAKLRARTRSEGQRKSAEESSHRGHQDGTKTEHAGFEDGVLGVHATLTLCLQGEVDHHDGILLDDTNQQHNADDGDYIEIFFEEHESKHGANTCRG